jgi:DNA-binding response OmpR family regulator
MTEMNRTSRPASTVRESSPFLCPLRVRVLADSCRSGEALDLAEALEECGVEADVRLGDDMVTADFVHPDAVVVDVGMPTGELAEHCRGMSVHPVVVAVAEPDDWEGRERARSAGYDLVVTRPLNAERLLERLCEKMPGMRA